VVATTIAFIFGALIGAGIVAAFVTERYPSTPTYLKRGRKWHA